LILSSAVISILSAQDVNKKFANMATDEIMEINMVGGTYFQLIFDYRFGKDARLYSRKLYYRISDSFTKVVNEMYSMISKLMLGSRVITAVCSVLSIGIIYCFIGYKAYYGAITIGEIMQYTGAVTQMMAGVILLTTSIGQLINNNHYFEKFFDLIELDSGKYMGTLPVEKRDDNEYTLELRNVSFKYPGTEKYVLKNINMKLNIGEKLAVVGMNGSGKTTFIKLLARLYDPDEGEILLNGINIKKYDYDEYLRLFSVVFQDFKLFSFSLGQNVASSVEVDEVKANYALKEAGFEKRVKELPKGLETCLYQDFDDNGVEISGGEAQKIAMARALYKDAPFVILDEPTAALDPISEFEIYTKFDEIVNGKTAIYISHRLSSCRFCHDIAVFHEGEIIQRGSHEELIQDKNGKYYELWNAQAQYYKDEEVELLMA
jgi:ATP-binding cassette subfamily B protein